MMQSKQSPMNGRTFTPKLHPFKASWFSLAIASYFPIAFHSSARPSVSKMRPLRVAQLSESTCFAAKRLV